MVRGQRYIQYIKLAQHGAGPCPHRPLLAGCMDVVNVFLLLMSPTTVQASSPLFRWAGTFIGAHHTISGDLCPGHAASGLKATSFLVIPPPICTRDEYNIIPQSKRNGQSEKFVLHTPPPPPPLPPYRRSGGFPNLYSCTAPDPLSLYDCERSSATSHQEQLMPKFMEAAPGIVEAR